MENMEENRTRKKWYRIIFLGVYFVFLFFFIFFTVKSTKDSRAVVSGAVSQVQSEKEKIVYIYKNKTSDYNTATINPNYDPENFVKVGEYRSYKEFTHYGSACDEVLINEDGYKLYNFVTKKERKLSLENKFYKEINLIYYEDKIYGISVKQGESCAFFSVDTNKLVTDFSYRDIDNNSPDLTRGYVLCSAYLSDENETKSDIWDIKTAKIVYSTHNNILAFGNEKGIYYAMTDPDQIFMDFVRIYNSDFEGLFDEVGFDQFAVAKDGSLLLKNKTETFSRYDRKGKLLSVSKKYKSLDLVGRDGYIAVIDNDNYFKLLDSDEKVLATFTKWNQDLNFLNIGSGMYQGGAEKKNGVYLMVRDEAVPEGMAGNGREYFYDISTGETEVFMHTQAGAYAKPVLYLYPQKKTDVVVRFAKPELLTTTYPKFNDCWKVSASPNGDLFDSNNQYYYALYWEESGTTKVDFRTGFYVTKENAIAFLEEKLLLIGLNARERNEFIMYWLPILEKNGKNLVYFELTQERQRYNQLMISPAPDSLLRVAIHIKKVEEPVTIKEQTLERFERKGFAAVEWGGVEH